jgi:membrane associated rhomboid family serine protease
MLIPYNTDAPLYYRPIGTIGLIAANVCAYIATCRSPFEAAKDLIEPFVLHHDVIAPPQWLTSNFIHADLFHLLGNMMFLWVFGLVVEGKLGWWRFVPAYLAVGVVQCAAEQIIALAINAPGVSLGASAAIYGLMGMALIWAPKNEIYCLWIWRIGIAVSYFEVSIQLMAVFFVGIDFLTSLAIGFRLSTPVLHLMGLVPGIVLGILLLKLKIVDGEGWDLFSLIAGNEGTPRSDPVDEPASQAESDEQRLLVARKLFNEHLTVGDCTAALALHKNMEARLPQWRLNEPMQQQLIALLLSRNDTKTARPLLADYIKRFPAEAPAMRVALAEMVLREENRPGKAIAILSHIPQGALSGELERQRAALHKEACARRDDGEMELVGDET